MHQFEERIKRYLFVSDFDHTLSFNDSGFVLSDLLGIDRLGSASPGFLKSI
jgi:2-hydroxy-3-keto-5-methylthiopentenyl-1-phosphate phosphatase